jgi:hypothetical protein
LIGIGTHWSMMHLAAKIWFSLKILKAPNFPCKLPPNLCATNKDWIVCVQAF